MKKTKAEKNQNTKASHQRNLESKRFYCQYCHVNCRTNHVLQNHLKTKKHKNIALIMNVATNTMVGVVGGVPASVAYSVISQS